MQSASATSPRIAVTPSLALRHAAVLLLGSLFVAVCAHIAVPLWFTPVPVTLQTFAVLLLGLALSPRLSAATLALYLVEGMCGLPVFSPTGPITFLHLFGPTGGYLLAYPAAAALTGLLRRRLSSGRIGSALFTSALAAAATGSALILLSGAAWLTILTHQSPSSVFILAVAPFLPGDILKLIASAGIAYGWNRYRTRLPAA
jgi:biotin transport system substrate-specific component